MPTSRECVKLGSVSLRSLAVPLRALRETAAVHFRHAAQTSVVALVVTLAGTPLLSSTSHAQGDFAGTWTIAEWKVAPWVKAAERGGIKPNTEILNRTLTFSAKGVAGPKLLSCPGGKYEHISSPYEGLFEGGLPQPATDGIALGFKLPVRTLRPACDFDFHLRDANSMMFALDNVLYTMKKKAPASR